MVLGSGNTTEVLGAVTAPDAKSGDVEALALFGKSRFSKWLVTTIAVVVLASGLGWWFGAGPGALRAMPDVTGRTMAQAETALNILDPQITVTNEYSGQIAQGKVIRTEPGSGALVFAGSQINIVVSLGPELKSAPKLDGLDVAQATIEITKAGFVFGGADAWFDDSVAAGLVFDYTGSDGTKIAAGSTIDLKVSLGSIPVVAGITQEAAVNLLTAAGLTVDSVVQEYSETIPSGQVIALTPLSEPLGANGSVELKVSKGSDRVTMPKVVGETIAAAKSALTALGLKVVVDTDKLSTKWGIYRVKSASVSAGTVLHRGDTVTIVSR
jgi:serine/threonine-protein kinase